MKRSEIRSKIRAAVTALRKIRSGEKISSCFAPYSPDFVSEGEAMDALNHWLWVRKKNEKHS